MNGAKTLIPNLLQAGNVVTGDMVEALVFAGADIIKVRYLLGLMKWWLNFTPWEEELGLSVELSQLESIPDVSHFSC